MTGPQRKRAFAFVLVTLTLDAMGIGLILPVLPDLIAELNGSTIGAAAVWGGILTTSFAVMQFACGPLVGSLSDRFGRRPVLLVSLLVMALDYVVMAVAGTIWLLLLGRIVGGITAATQSTATAFIADISKPEDKAANFGLVGAAFGVGFVLGPAIGGVLGEFGPRVPFWGAAVLAAANFVFGYFVLPETVTDRIRRPFSWRRSNPLGAVLEMRRFPELWRILGVIFIRAVAFFVYPAVWAYYMKERFDFSPAMIGASLAAFGVFMAIVQGGLIRVIIDRLGEHRTVLFGLVLDIAAFLVIASLWAGWQVFVFTPLTALGAVAGPALTGIASRTVDDDQQGELQGILASVNAIALVFSPLLMTWLFFAFTTGGAALYLPAAPFLMSAFLSVLALLVFLPRKRLGTA